MATEGNRAKNARRQAERRIAELGRQFYAATTEQSRNAIQARINDIKAAIAETRMYGANGKKIAGRTFEDRKAAIDRLIDLNKAVELPRYSSVRASNKVFTRNMESASRGEATDALSQNAAHAFMRATQEAWEGKGSVNERYERIKDYYGTNDLQLIYDAIYFEHKEKIVILNKVEAREQLTFEEKQMMQEMMREDDDLEKRYRRDDKDAPLRGLVAASIPQMTKARFQAIINSADFKKARINHFKDTDATDDIEE